MIKIKIIFLSILHRIAGRIQLFGRLDIFHFTNRAKRFGKLLDVQVGLIEWASA